MLKVRAGGRCMQRHAHGFTVIELIVVLAIIILVITGIVGGYGNMQRSQRFSNSHDKVLSTLHLARSLAISNNSIYHIRVKNWTDVAGVDPFSEQGVAIHCYPKVSHAITVSSEAAFTGTGNDWSAHSSLKDENGDEYLIGVSTQAFNNYRVDQVRLDKDNYVGIQTVPSGAALDETILFFFPDGSASASIWIFVTNNKLWRDDRSLSDGTRMEINLLRREAINRGDPGIRAIRVYQGGMIKPVDVRNQGPFSEALQ